MKNAKKTENNNKNKQTNKQTKTKSIKKKSNSKINKNTNLLTPYQYTLSRLLQTLNSICRKKIHKY